MADLPHARVRMAGPAWGAIRLEQLFENVAELPTGRFGPLSAVFGWVEKEGPGVALRLDVKGGSGDAMALRLREEGRYVRSRQRRFGDKHRDLTLSPPLSRVVYAFLPYVALPEDVGNHLVLEAWVLEEDDPIAERLWHFALPSWEARVLENPLAVAAFAALSAARSAEPSARGPGLAPTRQGTIQAALKDLFGLDDLGELFLSEILSRADRVSFSDVLSTVRKQFSAAGQARLLGVLRGLSEGSPIEEEWIARMQRKLGTVATVPSPLHAHFETLGVVDGASEEVLREAYRQLAQRHHPDRVGGEGKEMKAINAAYAAIRAARGGAAH